MNSRNDAGFDADVMFVDVPDDGPDPLELFESESDSHYEPDRGRHASTAASPAAGPTRARRPIALDQVMHRLGGVTWEEGVAIVHGVCGILVSNGRDGVPEISGIAITSAGGLIVGTRGVQGSAGPILARMLHTLAATGSVPAPLRLLVTKWASASDGHSIAEFAKELGYFARPDGQNLLQGVYERAAAAVPVKPAPPQVGVRQVPPRARKPRERDSRVLYAAAGAVVVLAMAVTVHFGGPGGGSQASSTLSPVATAESDGLETGSNPTPGSQRGSRARAAAIATPRAADSAARTTPVLPVRPVVGAASLSAVSSAVRATLASPAATSPRSAPALPPSGAAASSRPTLETLEANPTGASRRQVSGPPIYSRFDSDVTPPAFLQQQVPAQLLSGLQLDMNTIELIVSENGSVEHVRLLSTPKRMPDMMLLSNAKNWVFEPALKDGQPVRYRFEVSWAATP